MNETPSIEQTPLVQNPATLLQPLTTIVIVNYNVKDFLFQCLQSIENVRSQYNVEVIVVDNNSHDGSVEFLRTKFSWVEFIELNENIGFGRANNIGIEKAKGEYTLLLNPDTIVAENTIRAMIDYLESNTSIAIAGCKVLNADGTFQVQCRRGFPTPWASFCKLFGLQALFPTSPTFAQYNQTFRSEDETYIVDAVIGAFMFCRTKQLREIGGFDPDFFMYAEDLDLCYRMKEHGYFTAYVPTSTIIHFKGESTRRSSMNEVKVFYNAMEIFASKHYGSSVLFLLFLKIGIRVRSVLAYVARNFLALSILCTDLLSANVMLMVATKIRFEQFLGFPDYAYPTVFIALSLVLLLSMISVGEYFEYKPSVRRVVVGYLISFFFLAALTYFFKDFGFSRGVLLMTIGLSIVASTVVRAALSIFERMFGKNKDRRIAIVGANIHTERIIQSLQTGEARNAHVIGIVSTGNKEISTTYPVIGSISFLGKILREHDIDEVIITDDTLPEHELMDYIKSAAGLGVTFHPAREYESVVVSRVINSVSGNTALLKQYKISTFRNKLLKRAVDIVASSIALLIGTLIVILRGNSASASVKNWLEVLTGRKSLVGIFDSQHSKWRHVAKEGITGLAHISNPERLSHDAIEKLNEYYAENYSASLDVDILVKWLFRAKSTN